MKDILGSRGLSALGWLSAFGYLWAFALGLSPGGWTAAGLVTFSLLVALAAGADVAAKDRAEIATVKEMVRIQNRKAIPPVWTDPGSPEEGGKR